MADSPKRTLAVGILWASITLIMAIHVLGGVLGWWGPEHWTFYVGLVLSIILTLTAMYEYWLEKSGAGS